MRWSQSCCLSSAIPVGRIREMRTKGLEMGLIMGKGEFVPYLQPICDIEAARIVGAEVIPKQKDGRYVFGPQQFMKRIEVCGQTSKLDLFMLECACELLDQWKKFKLKLFVAQSCTTISLPGYVSELKRLSLQYKIDPSNLVIEITGSEIGKDEILDTVAAIRKAGFPVAIDHFGTDATPLNLLVRMQVEYIKLDESLLNTDHAWMSETVMESLLSLTQLLKISPICQNTKTVAQRALIQNIGCRLIQGTRTGRAMTPRRFRSFLGQWQSA